ncbi:MAG: pyridoxal 5'-phosphate synthase glutaminase subunit PdxT [Spirochaetaceae bacterium]|nr:MAG: pyridoxal 5'-phosphate synthase glutaminase subunit PdxT [Spirochaetaceae bacterium]
MVAVGVIAFQGDFQRHLEVLRRLGAEARSVRRPEELEGLAGLVIPGGESTTIGLLMERFGLLHPVRNVIREGLPVLGTCAGAILLAREIEESSQVHLGTLDIRIRRNAYGRQIDSFDASLSFTEDEDGAEQPIPGVFIRAPRITALGAGVLTLAALNGDPVVVRKENQLALTFHPELTGDARIHRLFLGMCAP